MREGRSLEWRVGNVLRPDRRLRGEHPNVVLLSHNPSVPVRIELVSDMKRGQNRRGLDRRLWKRL